MTNHSDDPPKPFKFPGGKPTPRKTTSPRGSIREGLQRMPGLPVVVDVEMASGISELIDTGIVKARIETNLSYIKTEIAPFKKILRERQGTLAGTEKEAARLQDALNALTGIDNFFKSETSGEAVWTASAHTTTITLKKGDDAAPQPRSKAEIALGNAFAALTALQYDYTRKQHPEIRVAVDRFSNALSELLADKRRLLRSMTDQRSPALSDTSSGKTGNPFKFPGRG